MNGETTKCLSCGRPQTHVPLIRVEYRDKEQWICPQCLPLLIHKPERLPSVAGEWTKTGPQDSHPD